MAMAVVITATRNVRAGDATQLCGYMCREADHFCCWPPSPPAPVTDLVELHGRTCERMAGTCERHCDGMP